MRKYIVANVAILIILPAMVFAQTKVPQSARLNPNSVPLAPKSQEPLAQIYTHPTHGFVIMAPPGAQIIDRKKGQKISIRSNKGYAVNFQRGLARPDIPLRRMSSLLEEKYLGKGKVWTTRTNHNWLNVAGLPSHETMYTGNSMRTRVIITRGAKNDYVFIFMAPNKIFESLSHDFNWIINNFKPSPKDSVNHSSPKHRQHVKNLNPKLSLKQFSEPSFGYVIEYPNNWEFNKPAKMAAMFSGPKGTAAYAAIIGVQNIQPTNTKTGDESVKRALNQLKSSLGNTTKKLEILRDLPWTYNHDGYHLPGRQITISYFYEGEHFIKHLIGIPRPKGTVAHVWSYTAPKKQFATFRPVAEKILSSWRILPSTTQ